VKGGLHLYIVEFYEDSNGNSEIREFLIQLSEAAKTDKNARINRNKIFAYIKALEEYGTRIGSPIVKHIEGNLWELRPLNNRIFFFYWKDNKFVLVHNYVKKSQKTPKKEIDKAMRNIKDWIERNDRHEKI
jgi:phage-related protein